MADARRRRFSTARGPRIRAQTSWTRIGTATAVPVAAATKVVLASLTPTVPGVTVRRIRGFIHITSDQSGATEEQIGAVGVIKVTDNALAVGAGSIPGPITDEDDEGWMLFEPFAQISDMTHQGTVARGSLPPRLEVDSKAMRKVPDGYNLVVMIENAHATEGLDVNFRFAFLSSAGYRPS